jgi:hypothetical protein
MRVFLHIGAAKTGTSAIQVALAALRPALAEIGIHYPRGLSAGSEANADRGRTSMGNAVALGVLLHEGNIRAGGDAQDVRRWLRAAMDEAGGRDLLLSSETMQYAMAPKAAELCELFNAAGFEPTVIFYYRPVLDQAISGFLQQLKSGLVGDGVGQLRDLSTSLATESAGFLRGVRSFARCLPRERLILKSFDRERQSLVAGFLALLTDRHFDIPAEQVVNRSPVPAEEVVLRQLARLKDGRRLCRRFCDLMLNEKAKTPSPTVVSSEDFMAFSERIQPIVNQFNNRFLDGEDKLLVKSDRVQIGVLPSPSQDEVNAVFAEFVARLDRDVRPQGGGRERQGGSARARAAAV